MQALDDGFKSDTARSMRLRIEKHLRMNDVVGGGLRQVGARHVVKVLLFAQHAGPGIVNVEKTLQVGKSIGAAQGLYIGIGQGKAVALRQCKNQLRFKRALDVDVQLRLGHAPQQIGQAPG